MKVFVGTSGYSYKEWKGVFYPEKIKPEEMLGYYGARLNSVEINNTFYRMPKESTLILWEEAVPGTFRFVLKASRRITHQKRLNEVEDELSYFLRVSSVLGERLGPTLFQLPPNFKKDMDRLNSFLQLLPNRWRAAMEFRHQSWFDAEVYDALESRGVALVFADSDNEELEPELVSTGSWGYLRLRREGYSETELAGWAERIRELGWEEVFVFFKHEDAGSGARLAQSFAGLFPMSSKT